MDQEVVVVFGVGGTGQAIARARGTGRRLLIADFNADATAAVAADLRADGYELSAIHVDVGSRDSVAELVGTAHPAAASDQT